MAKAPSVADQNVTEKDKNDPGEQRKNSTDKKNPNLKESYADSYLRVSKDNLYMTIALWMEDFVDAKVPEGYNKVGAVLVLPNDVVLAADCSRDDVHAVARLLMKHCDKAKGCKIFMSRKPCSFCAKLLVQSKVERVLFLPFEPEYYRSPEAGDQKNEVDTLFTASPIAQTIFVFHIDESVLHRAEKKTPTNEVNNVDQQKHKLINIKYSAFKHDSEWMKSVKEELPWKIFDDKIAVKVCKDFLNFVEWIARVLVTPQSQSNFKPCVIPEDEVQPVFDPVNDKQAAEQAKHFITIARFLATRTDDPTTGVGAVIVSPEMEILALGWNGFPLKAQYGEFGRGSDEPADAKYPYVIHAEQNALLMRNNKNVKGAILFVTKSPCNECAPLIAMQGIETVVVDEDVVSSAYKPQKKNGLSYKKFLEKVTEGKFVCFHIEKKPVVVDAKGIETSDKVIKNFKNMPKDPEDK